MNFVLDASMALAWCFPDEANDQADKVLRLVIVGTAYVPAIWPLEGANALRTGVYRGHLTNAQLQEALELIRHVIVSLDSPSSATVFGRTLSLALRFNLSVYDASYLELAERQSVPLATHDERLSNSAKELGLAPIET
ncbi:MAG: type II toxin-antitoxin system VapC family toxin [Firmicutes bacterium]|nr:type II toxin-antitoxin system VapC family toxin [Bacillota bacterium]